MSIYTTPSPRTQYSYETFEEGMTSTESDALYTESSVAESSAQETPVRSLFQSPPSETTPMLPKNRKKCVQTTTKVLNQRTKDELFSKTQLFRKAFDRRLAKMKRDEDPFAGCKDTCWFAGKVLVGTAIFPLGIYWLCSDQRPSADDIAVELYNVSERTHKDFFSLLSKIESEFFPLYPPSKKFERRFDSLATLQEVLFAELIARTYTLLGKPVNKELLHLSLAIHRLDRSTNTATTLLEKLGFSSISAARLSSSYETDRRIEGDIIRSVRTLPCGYTHPQNTHSFCDSFQQNKLLSDEEGELLKNQIYQEALFLQRLTSSWIPSEKRNISIARRLLKCIFEYQDRFPLLSTLADYESVFPGKALWFDQLPRSDSEESN